MRESLDVNAETTEKNKVVGNKELIEVKSNSKLILPNVGVSHHTYQLMKENKRIIESKGSFFRRKR